MTKANFRLWLQGLFVQMTDDIHGTNDCGAVWRCVDDEGLLSQIGVTVAMDPIKRQILFRCTDGVLASYYGLGGEGQTIWSFRDHRVDTNMEDATMDDVANACTRAKCAAADLERLLAPE